MSTKSAFVVVCVEGQSDEDALRDPLTEIFCSIPGGEKMNVEFRQGKCDLTSAWDITNSRDEDNRRRIEKRMDPQEIIKERFAKNLYETFFRNQDKKSILKWCDVTHIIHIVDIDGTYVDDVRIFTPEEKALSEERKTNNEAKNTLYLPDHIAVCDGKHAINILERNKTKRQRLELLIQTDSIEYKRKTVGYSVYYFCTNIDHFLHGDANLSGPMKMREAAKFIDTYSDVEAFADYMINNEYCSREEEYEETWSKLRKKNESLKRGTNVNRLIKRIQSSTIEDWI